MAARDPALTDRVGDVERPVHHDIGDGVEPARREVLRARNEISRCIVDEVGEGAVLERALDHGIDSGRIADIDAMCRDLPAVQLHQFRGGVFADALAAAADMDFRAEAEKFRGHGLAEAGAAAGHQDFAACEKTLCEHDATLP